MRWGLWVALAATLMSCSQPVEEIVVHRSNCLTCHRPLRPSGTPHGIEEAHPWFPLTCTACHGGTDRICDGDMGVDDEGEPACDGDWVYDRELAHVSPGDAPKFIRNLPASELDDIDPDYLQFINPGDLRIAYRTCGVCHPGALEAVQRSTMAHTSGELTVARYRSQMQPHPRGIYGAVDVEDDNKDPENACGVESMTQFDPEPIDLEGTEAVPSVGRAQEQYMVKSCMRCHLNDFGENRFPGDFRSSGCTACHMVYANDGLSQSDDKWISKLTVPHPVKHVMTTAPPVDQCTHCHYRGGRIGISYQGYREAGGAGLNPPKPAVLGVIQHGHDANYYFTEEDFDSGWDETPPDVHFEAGMHCVDCHSRSDIHGDGHIYADTQCAVSTRCEDCHGTVREYASPDPARPHVYERDGILYLETRIGGIELEVPQTKDVVTPGHPRFNPTAEQSMGVHDGFSHTDEMECYTCHAGWQPSCYGCHVNMDMSEVKAYQTTGRVTAGRPTGSRRWVTLFDMVLMRNSEGKMAPSMPAERFFMTLTQKDEEASQAAGEKVEKIIYASKPRTFVTAEGRKMASFGQRAFNPHTTRRKSQFMACDRCHTIGDPANPDNAVLLDITHGFGSERFPQEACDVTNDDESCDPATDWITYMLDAIQTREGEPLVIVGHPDPLESRPLTLEEIEAMRAILVPPDPPYSTPIPADALTNPKWPAAQQVEEAPPDPEPATDR